MAGGWSKRGSGIPLSDRVLVGGSAPGPASSPTPPSRDVCPARHCWVEEAVDGRGVRRPGLLSEWRQGESGWEGRVVYAALLRPETWVLVEEWIPAGLLTPL